MWWEYLIGLLEVVLNQFAFKCMRRKMSVLAHFA